MDSLQQCGRCRVRPGAPLCTVCGPAGPLRWHASRPSTWLPAECAVAITLTVIAICVSAAACAAGGHLLPRPLSLPVLDWLRLGAQVWWLGLGAPASLWIDASVLSDGELLPVGTFAGQLRAATSLGAMLCGLVFMLGGATVASRLRCAAEIEHLVAGSLLGLPTALASGAAASLLPLSVRGLKVGDASGAFSLTVSPLHAASVGLLWGMLFGALGAVIRYAWRTRGAAQRWAGFGRGAWPPLAGGVLALCIVLPVATLGTGAQWPIMTAPRVEETLGVDNASSAFRNLALEAAVSTRVALATTPLALDVGAPVRGRIVVGVPPGDEEMFEGVPLDTRAYVGLLRGVGAQYADDEVASPLPPATLWALLVAALAGLVAGATAGALAPTAPWRSAIGGVLVFGVGSVALGAWMGVWAAGKLVFASNPGHGLELWGAWRASLSGTLLGSIALALPAALLGASRNFPVTRNAEVEEISPAD